MERPEKELQETSASDSTDNRYLLEELLSAELRHLRVGDGGSDRLDALQAMITLDSFFGVTV